MEQQSNFIRNVTLGYGVFLIAWGIVIQIVSKSASDPTDPSFVSSTPFIIFGALLSASGLMVIITPRHRKLWMHIAATLGLLYALVGTPFFMDMGDGITYASCSMLMLFITGTGYTVLCVRSFIAARKAREASKETK
jgi:hypothetical protein